MEQTSNSLPPKDEKELLKEKQERAMKSMETHMVEPDKNSPYATMGVLNYLLTLFIFSIPVLGFLYAAALAMGVTKLLNKRHMACAYLILSAVCVVLFIVLYKVWNISLGILFDKIIEQIESLFVK